MEPELPPARPVKISGVVLSAKLSDPPFGTPLRPIAELLEADGPDPEVFVTIWMAGVDGDGIARFLIRQRTESGRLDLAVLIADPAAEMVGTNVPLQVKEPGVVILELYDIGADAIVWEQVFEVRW